MKNPQLTEYGRRLREALDLAAVAQSNALDRAIASGQIVCEVKDYLRANPTILQSFEQWFRASCRKYSLSTASTYARVYKHVSVNKNTCYKSIKEVLNDYRLTHPRRPRYVPPTTKPSWSGSIARSSRRRIMMRE